MPPYRSVYSPSGYPPRFSGPGLGAGPGHTQTLFPEGGGIPMTGPSRKRKPLSPAQKAARKKAYCKSKKGKAGPKKGIAVCKLNKRGNIIKNSCKKVQRKKKGG